MLVEFTVENFRSIRDKQTFSMEATKLKSSKENRHLDESNVFEVNPKMRLVTAAAIYGANSSGKSNLVKALEFMRQFVLNSSREGQIKQFIKVEPFLLSEATEKAPSLFEVVFFVEDRRFRYGFQADEVSVKQEWLFEMGVSAEKKLFTREGQVISRSSHNYPEGRGVEDKVRPNALFLSVCAQFNGIISTSILSWFTSVFITSGLDDKNYAMVTLALMGNERIRSYVDRFLKQLDVSIQNVTTEENNISDEVTDWLPEEHKDIVQDIIKDIRRSNEIETLHVKYNKFGSPIGQVKFSLDTHESEGTKKVFFLSVLLTVTLAKGTVLVIDELDARLHPLMTCAIIQLFGDKESNPYGAQLIFTTHDTNLLSNSLFRRDQIWFVEKDNAQGTNFYSLAEFPKRVRYDANLEDAYIHGKFGAIPFLGDLKAIVREFSSQKPKEQEMIAAA